MVFVEIASVIANQDSVERIAPKPIASIIAAKTESVQMGNVNAPPNSQELLVKTKSAQFLASMENVFSTNAYVMKDGLALYVR